MATRAGMNKSQEGGFVCKKCLLKNERIQALLHHGCEDKQAHKFTDTGQKEYVQWNGMKLVPSIRQFPIKSTKFIQKLTGIAMCKGKNCRLEMCTYAHNREEHMRFNNLLTSLRQEPDRSQQQLLMNHQTSRQQWPSHYQQPSSHWFSPGVGYGYQPPGTVQPDIQFPQESPGFPIAHGLHPTLVPSPHATLGRPQITNQPKYSHQEHEEEYAASKEKFEERIMEELDERYVQEKLTRENYKRKYHNLICWEEKEHIDILQNKCAGDYDLEIYKMGYEPNWIISWDSNEQCYYGVISGISPDQIAYATQASEAAFIVDSGRTSDPFGVRCEILPVNFRHSDDKLYVTFSAQSMGKLGGVVPGTAITVKVEFEVKHHFFNNLIDAVSSISSRTVSRIVPNGSNDFSQPMSLSREESGIVEGLVCDTDEHKKILENVAMCQASSPPVLVCGAFGTGKTRLLALIARLYIVLGRRRAQNTRVLMVAHHQATADILLDSYCKLLSGMEDGIVRVTSYRYKPPSTLSENVKRFFKKCHDVMRDCRYQKHHQIELVISTFETSLNLKNVLSRNGLEQRLLFTHILIDEGAQAWEPEAVAPLCFASDQTKIVIVGDPLQVGPSLLVLGEKSRENGLKHSILERLQSIYTKIGPAASPYSLTLAVNHRCNDQILEIPRKLFYTNIIANPAIVPPHPNARYPLIFVCSSISEQQSPDSQKIEAEILLSEALKYVSRKTWPRNWGPYCNDKIAILTTTRTQVVVVRKCARTKVREFNTTRIFPTYQIQGQEFQALFLSTTEPLGLDGNTLNPTKSSCDPFVFNTMLTRAKSLVVVVGNPIALLRTEEHMVRKYGVSAKCWSNFLHLCLAKKTFYVPDIVLKSAEKQTQFKRSIALKVQDKIRLVPATRQISTSTSSRANVSSILSVQRTASVMESTGSHIANVAPPSSFNGLKVHATHSTTNPSPTIAAAAKNTTKLVPHCSSKGIPTSARPGSLPSSVVHQQPPSKHSPPVSVPSRRFNPSSFSVPKPSGNAVPSMKLSTKPPSKSGSQVDGVIEAPASYHQKNGAQQKTSMSKADHPQSKLRIEDKDEFPDLNSAKIVKTPKRKRTSHKPQPQQEVRNYTLDSHSKAFKKYDLSMDEISCELTKENYKHKFHHLLSWEEQEHCNVLERYNDKFKVVLFERNSSFISRNEEFVRYGYISCKDNDSDDAEKLSYAKQASEGSFLILNERIVIHASHIPFHQSKKYELPRSADQNSIVLGLTEEQNRLLIAWNPKCNGYYAFRDYVLIQFELKHAYFQRLHNALDNLPQCIVDRLIPIAKYQPNMDADDIRIGHYGPYENLELDRTCQMQALNMILSSKSKCPLLIAGPFGTGKTRVLARAAFEILRNRSNNVLICAHHQASVDTFVKYFCSMQQNENRPWYQKFIRVATPSHHSDIKNANPEVFISVRQANGAYYSHGLVVTTLGLAPHLSKYGNGYFTHILIDEGAQTREPETVGPLSLAGKNTTIIIAGDHNQVGPRLLVFGKEAQNNGLGTSIMERLYAVYEKLPDGGRSLHAELSTNYRCHHGILMLPSYLFYESTLLSRSRALTHPDAPYPLVFVCSSLDDNKTAKRGTDVTEADCVLNHVEKYLKKWPRHWGDMRNAVCIMSSSENQCSLIKKKLYKKDVNIKSLEILKAYEIQGREYRAIFISTVEKTDEYGKPCNQTKTLSDRYVFNTAITRSQSLVVVVGNPYLLLRGEDNVGDNYNPQHNPKCWSHYLQRCFESRSFELSETIERTPEIQQKIMKLKDRIYSRCHPDDQSFSDAGSVQEDAILKAYKSALSESHVFKNARLKLSREGADVLTWNIKEENDTPNDPIEAVQEEHYAKTYVCVLRMHHFAAGEAFPLDGENEIVKIRGFNNRKGAFDGDTVEIGIFDDNPIGKCYGRVIRVIERGNDQYFLCQVKRNATCLSPVSRVDPLFINLPFLTRRILQNGDKDSIHDHLQSTDSVVVVFDAQSVENSHDLPQIKKTYPSSVANDMLFLVKFVKWDLKYRNPLGAVIEALPKGVNLYNAQRLLRLQYNIKPSIPMKNDELFKNPPSQPADYFCLTIDPENARLLDDAISLKRLANDPSVFELGIHIINVAKYVTRGSFLDKEARHRVTSVYPGCSGTLAPIDMLPPSFRENLSLMPHKKQHAFTVMMKVKVQDQEISIIGDPSTNATVVESALKLTYETAQQIMDSEITTSVDGATLFEQKSFITLKQALKLLYLISSHLRRSRLQNDSCFVYDISDPGEEKCWQAHLMIEELMIFANEHVATLLHSKQPNSTILRRQRYPNMQKRAQVIDEHRRVMQLSHSFTQLVPPNQDYSRSAPDVLVPTRLLEEMLNFNCNLLANRLSSTRAIPQLSVVDAQLRSCYAAAEYCYTVEGADEDEYRHYSLNILKYTHFSSPLRRYVDIVTQQMLTEVLDQNPIHFSREELAKLCPELNKKSKNAKRFESQMSVVSLAADLMSSSEVFDGFVCSMEKGNTIELTFSSLRLKYLMSKDRTFRLQHLGRVKSVDKHGCFSIDMQVASMNDQLGAVVLGYTSLVNLRSTKDTNGQSDVHYKLWTVSDNDTLTIAQYQANIQPDVVSMSAKQWKDCMEFVKDPCDERLSTVKGHLQNTLQASTQGLTTENVSTIGLCPVSFLKLQFKIKPYEMFKVWLSWSGKGAFINPTIQIVELSQFVRVCVQHNSQPAECFSDPILIHASRRTYSDINRYVELWEKIILAEASQSSVRDSSMVILQDVVLRWPPLQVPANCVDEKYYLPTGDITLRIPDQFSEHCIEIFKIRIGDLVCARYGIEMSSSTRAVFHFVVCDIHEPNEIEDWQTVSLKVVGKSNCRISEQVKSILKSPCELQVITLSTSFQRVYSGLLNLLPCKKSERSLTQGSSELAKAVALGKINRNKCGSVNLKDVDSQLKTDENNAMCLWNRGKRIRLNKGQEAAIRESSKCAFHLIQGPPGTGKSETGAHLAYIFANLNKRDKHKCSVLYCGPSNKAVDVVLEKFHKLKSPSLKILRIYGKATESKDFPNPGELGGRDFVRDSGYEPPTWAKDYALHHIIRKFSTELQDKEKEFSKLPRGSIPSGKALKSYRKLIMIIEKIELLKKYDMIFCTCNEAASARVQKYVDPKQVIIDESGMATEPETIIPISICDHVTVIGDHKQLQPVIEYSPARDKGLSTSLFERYADNEENFTNFLDTQYRMHEEICRFPSQHFYDGKLLTDISVKQRRNPECKLDGFWPGPQGSKCPILFCDVVGTEMEEETSNREGRKVMAGSKSNIKDAKKTIQVLSVLHFIHKVDQAQLAVLTPYSSQEVCIRHLADKVGLKDITVTTIIKSQGDEYGFVVLSTVRSQPIEEIANPDHVQPDRLWLRENLGFVTDEHQTNVGITRSKYGLIIVGNRRLLEYDLNTWKPLIEHYKQNSCIRREREFPRQATIVKLPQEVRTALR